MLDLYANIQAALYNGPLQREDKQPWTPAMFRPGVKQQAQDTGEPRWKDSLARARAAAQRMGRAHQPEPAAAEQQSSPAETLGYFMDRSQRAQAAVERGESREVVDQIMRGLA